MIIVSDSMVNRVIEISLNILMAPEAVTDAININTKRMWRFFTLVIKQRIFFKIHFCKSELGFYHIKVKYI
jgi:hypothetical protein